MDKIAIHRLSLIKTQEIFASTFPFCMFYLKRGKTSVSLSLLLINKHFSLTHTDDVSVCGIRSNENQKLSHRVLKHLVDVFLIALQGIYIWRSVGMLKFNWLCFFFLTINKTIIKYFSIKLSVAPLPRTIFLSKVHCKTHWTTDFFGNIVINGM